MNAGLLFVYGTLKKGFHNHYYLAGKTTFLHPFVLHDAQLYLDRFGDADCEKLRLKAQTPFDPWPYLKNEVGPQALGELYQVDDPTLFDELDRLEETDLGFYQRQLIPTVIGDCYAYFFLPPLQAKAEKISEFTLEQQGKYSGDQD